MEGSWYRLDEDSVILELTVRPRGRRNRVGPVRAGRLVVEVTAPPDSGRANEAVVELLAEELGVRRRQVELLRGQTSRKKTVRVAGRFSARDVDRLVG